MASATLSRKRCVCQDSQAWADEQAVASAHQKIARVEPAAKAAFGDNIEAKADDETIADSTIINNFPK